MLVKGVCEQRKWAKISIKMNKGVSSETVTAVKALRKRVRNLPSLKNKKVVVKARVRLKQRGKLHNKRLHRLSVPADDCNLPGFTSCTFTLSASEAARRILSGLTTSSAISAASIVGQDVYDMLMIYFTVTVEVDPDNRRYVQVLVGDDKTLNLVNQLGIENLVAVRVPASDNATSDAKDGSNVAPQLELTSEVTGSSSEVDVYVIPESKDEDLQATTGEWLEPHATELADNFTATAEVGDSNELIFAVVKSSGETKSLEVIADEQEASSNKKSKVKYDPTLVYVFIAVGTVFGVFGIGVCIVVVIVSKKKSRSCKTHAAPEDKQVVGNDDRLFYQRTKSQVHVAFQEE